MKKYNMPTLALIGFFFSFFMAIYGAYKIGHKDGCYDAIEKENQFGINNGVGLSAYYWCKNK